MAIDNIARGLAAKALSEAQGGGGEGIEYVELNPEGGYGQLSGTLTAEQISKLRNGAFIILRTVIHYPTGNPFTEADQPSNRYNSLVENDGKTTGFSQLLVDYTTGEYTQSMTFL